MRLVGPRENSTMHCNFERLVQYIDHELDLDRRLELLLHLDSCGPCRDAIYNLTRDRDASFFIRAPYREKAVPA